MTKIAITSPKGVKDILPDDEKYWSYIKSCIQRIVNLYDYKRIDLPVFEETVLYQRGVGKGTDIVEKEMYTFKDKAGTSITLRPEFTAGTVRAYIQQGMASMLKPVKLWSIGPVFRYERPQAGRFRQHTQFNVEALGEIDPALDFEIMSIAYDLFTALGFKNLTFQINSIGCQSCRPSYLKKLIRHYRNHSGEFCDECERRLKNNPLRVLDCKRAECQRVIEGAPAIYEELCPECRDHFETLKKYLDRNGRIYRLNRNLVRGLDYYTKTVFEVWSEEIGAQNAVCGGGRYDGLAEILGGPPTPGVGFASGLERIVMLLKKEDISVPDTNSAAVFFAYQGQDAKMRVVEMLADFRERGISSIMAFGSRSLKAQLREANRRGVEYTVIIGEDELSKDIVQVKHMKGEGQVSISVNDLIPFFKERGVVP